MANDTKKSKVIQIHIPWDIFEEFKQLCKDSGMKVSPQVRKFIYAFIQHKKKAVITDVTEE